MAVTVVTTSMAGAINYTHTTDSSAGILIQTSFQKPVNF